MKHIPLGYCTQTFVPGVIFGSEMTHIEIGRQLFSDRPLQNLTRSVGEAQAETVQPQCD